jgi:hypothetical protein
MSGTESSQDTPFIAMEYLDGERLEKNIVRLTALPETLKVGYIVRRPRLRR